MRVLIACEFSGIVRDAFSALGHDAWSCDLLPTERPGKHFQCRIEDILCEEMVNDGWDLTIAFPPCTHLAVSGARWFKDKTEQQKEGINFFGIFTTLSKLWAHTGSRFCIENPIGIMSTLYRKPDQIIQPWQFGHGETKATCLWLTNLPPLKPTDIVDGRVGRVHREPPGPDRWKNRSRTYTGIANAMATQWGV